MTAAGRGSGVTAAGPRAWVAFDGRTELAWLRLLKPGFRHCLVVVEDGGRWIMVDPVSPFTLVALLDLPDGSLPGWLAGLGLTVVETTVCRTGTRPAPWAPFTCVEAVKRVLGLRAAHVLTPWQLYRYLTRTI